MVGGVREYVGPVIASVGDRVGVMLSTAGDAAVGLAGIKACRPVAIDPNTIRITNRCFILVGVFGFERAGR